MPVAAAPVYAKVLAVSVTAGPVAAVSEVVMAATMAALPVTAVSVHDVTEVLLCLRCWLRLRCWLLPRCWL